MPYSIVKKAAQHYLLIHFGVAIIFTLTRVMRDKCHLSAAGCKKTHLQVNILLSDAVRLDQHRFQIYSRATPDADALTSEKKGLFSIRRPIHSLSILSGAYLNAAGLESFF